MFRLLGLLGGLSLTTDLGTGAPMEESLQRSLVATRLARSTGCTDDEVRAALYTALLQHLGCTAYAHELSQAFGDDVSATRLAFLTDTTHPTEMLRTWVPGLAAATGQRRSAVLLRTLAHSRSVDAHGPPATCDVAQHAARRLGLPPAVQGGLAHILTMWNGAGYPGAAGSDIALPARLMHVASTAVLFGPADAGAAAAEVDRRAGTYLDPDLARAFRKDARTLMAGIGDDAYRQLLDCEPDPVSLVDDAGLEEAARVFGDLVDLKSPRLHGHSRAVATTAFDAARRAGLGDGDARTVLLAGHLHDLGRVGVPSRVWDKVAALSASEQDQAALHPYHSERILDRIPSLAPVAVLAGQHHERCDGTGYHRGLAAPQLSMASRVLAAADAYQCLLEDRPGQPGVTGEQAADRLAADGRRGRLDAQAVSAVLEAVGQGHHAQGQDPGALTSRQVEVLRLVAAGLSNPEIARRLVISRRTAEHHVQDVYQRIGCSTRAGAALYAMEHGLLGKTG